MKKISKWIVVFEHDDADGTQGQKAYQAIDAKDAQEQHEHASPYSRVLEVRRPRNVGK